MRRNSQLQALLVDDDEEILELTKIYLRQEVEALKLEVTSSPEEALEKLEKDEFDVVVSDYKMPQLDGLELLERVKENQGKEVPFILFTGRGGENVAMEALNKDADGYIPKKTNLKKQIESLAQKIYSSVKQSEKVKSSEKSEKYDTYDKVGQLASLTGQLALETGLLKEDNETLRDIFSILSKEGSFQILNSARNKLHSKRGCWHEFGLSKRQYYSRLNKMKERNLIKREGEEYVLTEVGKQIIELLSTLWGVSENSNDFRGEDSGSDTLLERDNLFDASIFDSVSPNNVVFGNSSDYQEFGEKTTRLVGNSEEELDIALTFADQSIIRSFLDIRKNVNLRLVLSENALTKFRNILDNYLGKGETEQIVEKLSESVKKCKQVPFSFLVSDGKTLNLEIKNPLSPTSFFQGFLVKKKEICDSFLELFDDIYKGSEKINLNTKQNL